MATFDSKRLHDQDVGAEAVTAVRYLLIVALAIGFKLFAGGNTGIVGPGQFLVIAGNVLHGWRNRPALPSSARGTSAR